MFYITYLIICALCIGILGATSIAKLPVMLQTIHLLPLQIGHLICALCGAGRVTVTALFFNTHHLPFHL